MTVPTQPANLLQQVAAEVREFGAMLRPHLGPILAVLVVVAFLYRAAFGWLWNAWMTNDYYTHGLLVPPVALWFMWRARAKIAAANERPTRLVDLWGIAAAFALYAYAIYAHDPFLLSLSLIALLMGVLLYLLGIEKGRYLLLPAAFLIMAVPLPNLLYIGYELQRLATWGTTTFMSLLGVDVVQDNFTITAGTLQFQVVPLCSGLSSTISILTLGTVIATLSPLRTPWRAALIALAIPVALFANVLRISLTVWVGITWGPEASEGFLHGASSLVLFLLALGGVLGLAALLVKLQNWGNRHE